MSSSSRKVQGRGRGGERGNANAGLSNTRLVVDLALLEVDLVKRTLLVNRMIALEL